MTLGFKTQSCSHVYNKQKTLRQNTLPVNVFTQNPLQCRGCGVPWQQEGREECEDCLYLFLTLFSVCLSVCNCLVFLQFPSSFSYFQFSSLLFPLFTPLLPLCCSFNPLPLPLVILLSSFVSPSSSVSHSALTSHLLSHCSPHLLLFLITSLAGKGSVPM